MPEPTVDDILNYLPLYPHIGTAGQPTREQFPAIREAGYQVVINLAMPTSDNAVPEEPALVAALGLDYIPIPVVWESPTLEDLQRFFAALEANASRRVFVHCALNMRVSAFMYLYRVLRLGVSHDEAYWDVLAIWEPNPTWRAFMAAATGLEDLPW